jgi:hypothetical protein
MRHSAKIRFVLIIGIALPTLASAQTTRQQPPNRAQVTYSGGKLSVVANNSSLNQILHDIASETGMKITGGVTDERVFGQYGPDVPSKILNILLDGTGSNILLVQATSANPAELILTPRHGGPTPPNPGASAEDDYVPPPPINPMPPRPAYPTTTPQPTPNASQPAGQTPNGPKTPQQIYEELQRLRQQQQQQQSNPP